MNTQRKNFSLENLAALTKEKMIKNELIHSSEQIVLIPHHQVTVRGELSYHYIITCLTNNQKYFLKVQKDNDHATHCNYYLRRFLAQDGQCAYPLILAPGFDYCGKRYHIYTYAEGETLEGLPGKISADEWHNIGRKLRNRIDELSTVHAQQYSDRNQFVPDSHSAILKRKIMLKLNHSVFSEYSPGMIEAAGDKCMLILDSSSFSRPTLLHMDIKPANIIYNLQTKTVSVIDFELARFGDIDYGQVQILLTELKEYGEAYDQYIFPELTKGYLTLGDALHIPKFQCYLFYQTACNLIYYDERKLPCPKKMEALFYKLLQTLSKG